MEDQLEATSRGRDEAIKQLRKIQVTRGVHFLSIHFTPQKVMDEILTLLLCPPSQGQVKDLQRELEDSRAAQKEVLASAREAERRSKAMEAEMIQLHEVRPAVPPSWSCLGRGCAQANRLTGSSFSNFLICRFS